MFTLLKYASGSFFFLACFCFLFFVRERERKREREREFQSIASAFDDGSLLLNQDTNWFLV